MALINELIEIMARLRDPETGCPWDLQQDLGSLAPYTIEEAYEVADAIERNDLSDLKDELGDLLFNVVFHAQLAREQGAFDFNDVVRAINEKMIRRHPHVFGNEAASDTEAVLSRWNETKAAERKTRGDDDDSALAGISVGLPEWIRATKLQSRAARTGFEWQNHPPVFAKLLEEVAELEQEFEEREQSPQDSSIQRRMEEELGDVLFVVSNLARLAKLDVGRALRVANAKFEQRFRQMEQLARQRSWVFAELSLEQQEALWRDVKSQEGPQR